MRQIWVWELPSNRSLDIFKVVTNHKPLIYAFVQKAKKASPRQQRQIAFIFQFTSEIEHLLGTNNVVADCLSRIKAIHLPTDWSLNELFEPQKSDPELESLINSTDHSLNLKKIQ